MMARTIFLDFDRNFDRYIEFYRNFIDVGINVSIIFIGASSFEWIAVRIN